MQQDLFHKFLSVLSRIEKHNVEYVLIGGFAVVLNGLPRATQDLDIFIKNSESNVKKLREALYDIFSDDSIYEITYEELMEYPVIRFGTNEGFFIDIVSRIGEKFSFDD